jgi:hypothetical protein
MGSGLAIISKTGPPQPDPFRLRQTGPIPHGVVGGLVDLGRTGRELVKNLCDLTGGIIARCGIFLMNHRVDGGVRA